MSTLRSESVGQKVAAALSGTFLGIFLAYGLEFQLRSLLPSIKLRNFFIIILSEVRFRLCYRFVSTMAGNRSASLDKLIQPTADEQKKNARKPPREVDELFPDQVKSKVSRYLVRRKKAVAHAGAWKVATPIS